MALWLKYFKKIIGPSIFATLRMVIATMVIGFTLGTVALNYGYQSFNNTILYTSVFILFVMVVITQAIGSWIYIKVL